MLEQRRFPVAHIYGFIGGVAALEEFGGLTGLLNLGGGFIMGLLGRKIYVDGIVG